MSVTTDPVVVCVAPNGARRGKADHARIPLTAVELAAEAEAVADAGAHALHLHVRDADGKHSLDARIYRQALDAIRARVGERLVVQVTTESVGIYAPEQQMAVIRELVPPCASVAIRELIREPADEQATAEFFAWAHKAGVGLQFIVYESAEVVRLARLQASGVVPSRQAPRVVRARSQGWDVEPAGSVAVRECMAGRLAVDGVRVRSNGATMPCRGRCARWTRESGIREQPARARWHAGV